MKNNDVILVKSEPTEEKAKGVVFVILAIIGAVAAIAGIAYAVYLSSSFRCCVSVFCTAFALHSLAVSINSCSCSFT